MSADPIGRRFAASARNQRISCPISGRKLHQRRAATHPWRRACVDADDDAELVAQVAASTGLTEREAARVVDDVVAYYAEPTEAFVRRRHAALKLRGMRNDEIFDADRRRARRRGSSRRPD